MHHDATWPTRPKERPELSGRSAAHSYGLSSVELWLLVALVTFQVAVVWWLPHLPFQDLPLHLETTRILQDHILGGDTALGRAFVVDVGLEPNGLIYVPLVWISLATGPVVAGKIVSCLYLILFPVAALYAIRGIRAEAAYLVLPAAVLAWSFPFTMGFLNFCGALILALCTFGFWARRRRGLSGSEAWILAAGFLLTVFLHAVPALFAMGWIAACILFGTGERPLLPLAAAVPALGVILVFLAWASSEETFTLSWKALGVHLVTFNSLVSFSAWERLPAAAFVLGLAATAWIGLRRPGTRLSRSLLVALAGLLGAYFVAPAGLAGGGYLNARLLLGAGVTAVLWLATRPALDARRGAVAGAGFVLTAALLAFQLPSLVHLGKQVDEVVRITSSIPPGSSVATLSWRHRGVGEDGKDLSRRVAPLLHGVGYGAAARGLVDLGHFHASQPYFPIRYRKPCDPFEVLWRDDLARQPPAFDLAAWESLGCRVDYFVLWGRRDAPLPAALADRYVRVDRASSRNVELYGRSSAASTDATQR